MNRGGMNGNAVHGGGGGEGGTVVNGGGGQIQLQRPVVAAQQQQNQQQQNNRQQDGNLQQGIVSMDDGEFTLIYIEGEGGDVDSPYHDSIGGVGISMLLHGLIVAIMSSVHCYS